MAPKRKAAATTAPPEALAKRPRGRPPKRTPSSGPSRASTTDSSVLVLGDPSTSGNESSGLSEVPDDALDAMEGLLGLSKGPGGGEELDEDEDEDEDEKEKEIVELDSSSEDEAVSKKKKKNKTKTTKGKKAVKVVDEELSSEDEDEDEDDDYENIKFFIPAGASVSELTLSIDLDEDRFFQQIADELEVRRSKMQIGYKLSTAPVRNKPILLKQDSKSYSDMIKAAKQEFKRRRKAKKASTKPFTIEIFDLREKKKETAADKKKKKGSKNKSQKANASPESSDEEGEGEDGGKTKAQYVAELQSHRLCDLHKRYCVPIGEGREHLELSIANISLWAVIMHSGKHISYIDPPDEVKAKITGLNPDNAHPRPHSRAPRNAATPAPYAPPPGPYPQYYPPPSGPYPYYGYGLPPPPPPPPHPTPPSEPAPQELPTGTVRRTNSTESDDSIEYPLLKDWLPGLDQHHRRGCDDHNFAQFLQPLLDNGYKRINQLLGESHEELQKLCPELKQGVAKLLVKYITKDCEFERQLRADWDAGRGVAA
ncbi:hypothetical protein C8F01DRAFT_1303732 [Mycena amicta]|nr:hypothetical protein C8F01DRAFT_1303732 [Mycena amicta]